MKRFASTLLALAALTGSVALTPPAAAQSVARGAAGDSLLRSYRWRSLGPSLEGGRVSDIAVANPRRGERGRPGKVMYVAAGTGGVWKTTNAGDSWTPVFDREATLAIATVAVAPSDPNFVWVGTGDVHSHAADITVGRGAYRSVDGGAHWQNVGFRESDGIGRIAIDPTDPKLVYVGVLGSETHPGGERGLYRTADGGKTWTRTLAIDEWTGVIDISIDPLNPKTVYAAGYHFESPPGATRPSGYKIRSGPGSGIYKSTDAGVTWRKVTRGLPEFPLARIGLSASPARQGVVYAVVSVGTEYVQAAGGPEKANAIYRSDDEGESWHRGAGGPIIGGASNLRRIVAHPLDANQVYLPSRGLQHSSDGGANFTRLSGFEGRRVSGDAHVDVQGMWVDPSDPDHLILTTDGGIWFTHDHGVSWSSLENIPVLQFYTVATDMRDPYHIYGGTQDNSMFEVPSRTRLNIGITNSEVFDFGGGDTYYVVADPVDTNTVYIEAPYPNMPVRFTRPGSQWRPIPLLGEKAGVFGTGLVLAISPFDHRTLYSGSGMAWRTTDRGDNWTRLSDSVGRRVTDSVTVAGVKRPKPRGSIASIAESPAQRGLIYVGATDGSLQITRDGGTSWSMVDHLAPAPTGAPVRSVVPSRHAAGTAYAVVSASANGDQRPYVFKTTDFGRSWTSIVSDLPPTAGSWVLVEHPGQAGLLFLGTEQGVYFTTDGATHWRALNNELPPVRVWAMTLQSRDNDLVIGTWGRGIYVLDDLSALEGLAAAEQAPRATLFPVRPAMAFVERWLFYAFRPVHQTLMANPPYGALISYYLPSAQKPGAVQLAIVDSAGELVRELTAPGGAGLQRVPWNLRKTPPEGNDSGPPSGRGSNVQGLMVPRGALVPPGTYRARLVVSGGAPIEVPVVVRADPAGEQNAAVLDSAYADRIALERAQSRLTSVTRAILQTSSEVTEAIAAIRAARGRASLVSLADSVRRALDTVAADGSSITMFTTLAEVFERATAPFSTSQRAALATDEREVGRVADRLNAIVTDRLPVLRRAMDAAGIPWTLGRKVP